MQQILEDETFIQVLKASEQREKAIAKLFKREKILESICQDIKTKLGFEFAAITFREFAKLMEKRMDMH